MKKTKGSSGLKTILVGGLAIGMLSVSFTVGNQYLFAKTYAEPQVVKTNYVEVAKPKEAPTAYVKANYTVKENALLPCTNVSAIKADKAAELGAMYLWDLFEVDLNGKTIQMSFATDPSRATAYWSGDVFENEDCNLPPSYSFTIEAISGKRDSAYSMNNDNQRKTVQYKKTEADAYYKDNCDEYLELAKVFAEKNMDFKPIKAEFISTGAILAEGYVFETLENETTTFSIDDDSSVIKVSYDDKYEAEYAYINIMVTDEKGNITEVSIDMQTKKLISIVNCYDGIDFDSKNIG